MSIDVAVPLKSRDLNWLSFNERVLQEAEDKKHNPLFERIKFLAIFSSNLDEFFRVRVSQLRQIKKVHKTFRDKLTLRPTKTVKEILLQVKKQQERFGNIYQNDILPELKANNITILQSDEITQTHLTKAEKYFDTELSTLCTPEIVSISSPNKPFLENESLYFFITYEDENSLGFVKIPTERTQRFLDLGKKDGQHHIAFLDDIIRHKINTDQDQKITGIYEIKLSRDAELYMDDELDGELAEQISKSLPQRFDNQPTRLLYDATMPTDKIKILRRLLGLGRIDMMPGGTYHNFKDFFQFKDPTNHVNLHYESKPLIKHLDFDKEADYFKVISNKDQLLHYPYISFIYLENFIEQAAWDKQVEEIKISFYRIADKSRLTSALLKALENDIKVTIFIEAKARFDEENNLKWGKIFEKNGAHVIYSFPRIKVHSKILLIKRKERNKVKSYGYISTGNFNAQTSKIYADHSLFTANKKITKELDRVFEVLVGKLIIPRNKHLLISPFGTRRTFEKLIDQEIANAQKGLPAKITAKLNSLEDTEIIHRLYKASNSGVTIRLIVRGFCCLIPGIVGLSENIHITSILDRYLEHGRIYLFHNNGEEKMYMGSADWMVRNLDRRIEVLTPIYDPDVFIELKEILQLQLQDNCKARIQDARETNTYAVHHENKPKIRSQYAIYDYLKEKHKK